MPGVYAGGDATSASHTVVEAIGSGKRAAVGIDICLTGADENIFRYLQKGGHGAISFVKYLNKNYDSQDTALASFKDINTSYFRKGSRPEVTELPIEPRSSNLMRLPLDLPSTKPSKKPNDASNVGNALFVKIAISFAPLSRSGMIGKDLHL
jgi:hypothetical protein